MRKQVYGAARDLGLERVHGNHEHEGRYLGPSVLFQRDGPTREVRYSEFAPLWDEPLELWVELVESRGMGGTLFCISPVHRFSLILVAQNLNHSRRTFLDGVEARVHEAMRP